MNHRSRRTASIMEQLEPRRLLASYAMDATFAGDGTAELPGYGSVIQIVSDSKILTGGSEGVKRLKPDGTLDASFVDKGTAVNNGRGQINLVVGDRIIIAGSAGDLNQSFFVRAIKLSNGDVDTSFGTDGVLYFTPQPDQANPKNLTNRLTSLVANPDGTLLLGASQNMVLQPPPDQIYGKPWYADFVYKVTASGKIDSTFGGGAGRVVIQSDGDDEVWPHLAPVPNGGGKFLVLGETKSWSSALWRYNANGTLDTTFGGGDGIVPLNPEIRGLLGFDAIYVQPDGKILLPFDDNPDFGEGAEFLMRLNADGSTDTSFANAGQLTLATHPGQLRIDSQGRIVGGGSNLFRLTPDGHPDPAFDGDGYVTTTGYFSLALDSQGRLIVGNGDHIARFAPGSPVQLAPDGTLRIDGDADDDTISVTLASSNVTVSRNGQATTFSATAVKAVSVNGFAGNDVITVALDVPVTVRGGDGNDSIVTGGGHDSIWGDDGTDTVDAGGGNDVVFGGYGGDSLYGNTGADIIWGDRGSDSVAGGDGNDRLFGDGPNDIIGDGVLEGDNDSLSGNAGNDHIDGMRGNDRVAGNGGRDRLFGGEHDDRIFGGDGGDWLAGGSGGDILDGGLGDDYLDGGAGVDRVMGNDGNDTFVSDNDNSAVDDLYGGGGADTLMSGDEDDLLTSIEHPRPTASPAAPRMRRVPAGALLRLRFMGLPRLHHALRWPTPFHAPLSGRGAT